jgi:hypothetical protein
MGPRLRTNRRLRQRRTPQSRLLSAGEYALPERRVNLNFALAVRLDEITLLDERTLSRDRSPI